MSLNPKPACSSPGFTCVILASGLFAADPALVAATLVVIVGASVQTSSVVTVLGVSGNQAW